MTTLSSDFKSENKNREARKSVSLNATFYEPWVGDTLIGGALAGFYFLCILLPIVGKAAAQVPWYNKNLITFSAVLLLSLGLSVAGFLSKRGRSILDGSPFPKVSLGLVIFYVLILLCLMTGLFKL